MKAEGQRESSFDQTIKKKNGGKGRGEPLIAVYDKGPEESRLDYIKKCHF